MPRYIDADAFLLAEIERCGSQPVIGTCTMDNEYLSIRIAAAPTISPDDVRGVGEITGDDACPSCGCWIPTDDAHDAIFKNEVKFCYYCGMRLRMKGAEDGTTD